MDYTHKQRVMQEVFSYNDKKENVATVNNDFLITSEAILQ